MPRIPGINYGAGPTVGPVQTGGVGLSGPSVGADLGLEQLGAKVSALGGAMFEAYTDGRAAEVTTKANAELQEYSQQLKDGTTDENGKLLPPPPPDQHDKLYQEKIRDVRARMEDDLGGGRALQKANSDVGQFAFRQQLLVKEHAIDQMHGQARALTDEALDKDAATFVNADELTKPSLQAQAFDKIQKMVKLGVYTPEEGLERQRRYTKDASVGSIIKMMRTNPDDAVMAIQRGEFPELRAEEQQHWISVAQDRAESMIRRQNAEADRDERKVHQEEKRTQDATAKDMWTLHEQGHLTPAWVTDHADDLSKEDYKMGLTAASGKESVRTDMTTYSDLRYRASLGQDVRSEAKQAYIAKLINREDHDRLFSKVESDSVAAKGTNSGMQGERFIRESLMPNPNTASGYEKENLARALDDWTLLVSEHPTLKPDEAKKEYERITESYRIVPSENMSLTKPVPRYLPGGRAQAMDREALIQAAQATKEKFQKGEITEREYNREGGYINGWLKLAPKPTPKPTPAQ